MGTTTIHIPTPLLEVIDHRARAEGLSRNRFILRAIERALEEDEAWSPGFIERLRRPLPKESARLLDEMVTEIGKNRSSKPPLELS